MHNDNSDTHGNVYGAVIMTKAIMRVQPVHWIIQTQCWVAGNPQIKPTPLGCESADKWLLPTTSTVAIQAYYCYSLRVIPFTHSA